ncbi:MAG TPA: IclR family transcriptional regulator C-terminal domain-containing protein [Conexibacter sp.]|nr:IclR family transcriptional regulator C-terminal domain-containing protein [Conexibacter sp.]
MSSPSVEDATAHHVRRTLRALELLADGPQTQADVARELAVHRRTARRLLARLVDEGYAEAAPGGRHVAFRATPRLAVIGRQVADGLDLLEIAQRHLAGFAPAQAGARYVALLEDGAVTLAHVEAPADVDPRVAAAVLPRSGPLHATAAGKVFLSADTALVGEVLNQQLLAYTASTHVTRADLLLELATARECGYAVEDGEHYAGLRAVASPIVDHVGRVVAALGAVPAPGVTFEEAGAVVRDAAQACSREIGAAV